MTAGETDLFFFYRWLLSLVFLFTSLKVRPYHQRGEDAKFAFLKPRNLQVQKGDATGLVTVTVMA